MSLERRDTVIIRTGLPGSGKSWSLAKYIVEEWIPNHAGIVFTNVPLRPEAIAKHFADKVPAAKRAAVTEKVLGRVKVIPQEVEQAWLDGESTPGEYFETMWATMCREAGVVLNGKPAETPGDLTEDESNCREAGLEHPLSLALVVIDEAGKMWWAEPDKTRKPVNEAVKKWLATIRHLGCRICFVCQDEMQIDAGIRRLRAAEILTTKMNTQPEPVTGALVDHWCQIWAKLTGYYPVWMREEEFVKEGKDLVSVRVYSGLMSPRYFRFYNSHNNVGGVSGREELPEYKRFGFFRFFFWVFSQNVFNWGWRFAVLVFIWVIFFPPFYVGIRAAQIAIDAASNLNVAGFAANGGKTPGESPAAKTGDEVEVKPINALTSKTPGVAPAGVPPVPEKPWPVGIVGDFVLLSDGSETRKGGLYDGKKIVRLVPRERHIVLDGGAIVWLPGRLAVRSGASSTLGPPVVEGGMGSPSASGFGVQSSRPVPPGGAASVPTFERRSAGNGNASPGP
jgi:hypothetical protein